MTAPHHCPTWEDPGGCRCDIRPPLPATLGVLRERLEEQLERERQNRARFRTSTEENPDGD